MRKSLWAVAMVAALVSAAPAAAEAWRVAASSPTAVMLVDTDSITRRGTTVFAIVITVAPPQRAGDWDRSVIRREIDCANSRSAMLERSFYRDGAVIARETNREPFDMHRDGSMMGGVLQAVCGTREYQSGVVADPVATAWGLLRGGSK